MQLIELIKAVKEEKLRLQQLEDYHTQLSNLFADLQLEMADLEKEEAMFMYKKLPETSVAQRKLEWKATREGQRLIVLKRYGLAVAKLLTSLKSRSYKLL
jgi:hypothetical protein